MDAAVALTELGLIAPRAELLESGVTGRQLTEATSSGMIVRLRRGWYAHPEADVATMHAIRVGGRLACVSALENYGLWIIDDGHLHVHVPASASRLRSPRSRYEPLDGRANVRVHRDAVAPAGPSTRFRVLLTEALAELVRHGDREASIASLDSAANRGLLDSEQLDGLFDNVPVRFRALRGELDSRCESGLESIIRVRLRDLGVPVATQVTLADRIRVDFLVGDRLVIEADGRLFHDDPGAFERDRGRDLYMKAFGYEVLRLTYRQVVSEWPSVRVAILRMLARRSHLWSP